MVWWDRRPAGLLIQSHRPQYKMTGVRWLGPAPWLNRRVPHVKTGGTQVPPEHSITKLHMVWWDRRPAGLLIQSHRPQYKMTGARWLAPATWPNRTATRVKTGATPVPPEQSMTKLQMAWWDRRPAGLLTQSPRPQYKMTGVRWLRPATWLNRTATRE